MKGNWMLESAECKESTFRGFPAARPPVGRASLFASGLNRSAPRPPRGGSRSRRSTAPHATPPPHLRGRAASPPARSARWFPGRAAARPRGAASCAGPAPLEPYVAARAPSGERRTTRCSTASATARAPPRPTATPAGPCSAPPPGAQMAPTPPALEPSPPSDAPPSAPDAPPVSEASRAPSRASTATRLFP